MVTTEEVEAIEKTLRAQETHDLNAKMFEEILTRLDHVEMALLAPFAAGAINQAVAHDRVAGAVSNLIAAGETLKNAEVQAADPSCRNRMTAISMTAIIRPASASELYLNSESVEPLSMIKRTIRR